MLAAPNVEEAQVKAKLWADYSETDGGIVENTLTYPAGDRPQRTLVLIKPDNFRFPTGRPGNVIDFFSRTGLYIVGAKVLRMSTAQAMEFYGPVREILRAGERRDRSGNVGGLGDESCAVLEQAVGAGGARIER